MKPPRSDSRRPHPPFQRPRNGPRRPAPGPPRERSFRPSRPAPAPEVDPVELACRVIAEASRDKPADAVLRSTLKQARGLSPEVARSISAEVFAYYRWFGWLDQGGDPRRALDRARQLDAEFQWHPESYPEAVLREKAVPAWSLAAMETPFAWLRSLQSPPRLWLRSRPGAAESLASLLGEGAEPARSSLPDLVEYRGPDDLFRRPEFHSGEFEIQDVSSQWVSLLCRPKAGETWWDACAGEGGKTLHLSALMQNKGLIWASDRAEWRLQNLKRRTARAGVFNYRPKLWDGSERLPTRTLCDGVLLDAPCSGVGTWQRNPHARWTTTPEDVTELSALQQRLLAHAAAAVKSGGRLVYAVCTLTRAETTEVADRFAAAFPAFVPLPLESPLKAVAHSAHQLTLWPQDSGGNGMFVAAWRKV